MPFSDGMSGRDGFGFRPFPGDSRLLPGRKTFLFLSLSEVEPQLYAVGACLRRIAHREADEADSASAEIHGCEQLLRDAAQSADSTAAGSVFERVICRKSAYLSFSTTVLPRNSCRWSRFQTSSRMPSSSSINRFRSSVSSGRVVSAPSDLRMRLGVTARSSMPRA